MTYYGQGKYFLGVSVHLLSKLYKTLSHLHDIRRGKLDSREYTSTPCIRNFSGRGSGPALTPFWEAQTEIRRIGALKAHLGYLESGPTQGMGRGVYPWYSCTLIQSCAYLTESLNVLNPTAKPQCLLYT